MNKHIENMKHTNNGREIDARQNLADVIRTCEGNKYAPVTAIWGALTLLGEIAVNLAVIADTLDGSEE